MKIKTLLLLIAAASIVVPSGIGTLAYRATLRGNAYAAQGAIAQTLIEQVYQLNTFADAYVDHRDARPRVQWIAAFSALDQTVADPALAVLPSSGHLSGLREQRDAVKRSFDALSDVVDAGTADADVVRIVSGDLLVKAQRLITTASTMAKDAEAARAAARAQTDRLVFSMLAALAVCATGTILVLYRRIMTPIAALQKGTAAVGRGDLSSRIRARGRDEIAALAAAFDAMAEKLQASYDTLEQKVADRTRDLEALSRKNETLLESIGDGVVAIDRQWTVTVWNAAAERITGVSKRDALGRPFRTVVRLRYEHGEKENVGFIEEAMLYGEVRSITEKTLLLRADNRELPVGDSAAPIRDEQGAIAGAIIVFRDVSPEREAMQLRSDFTYAAHQLRTPVTKAMWSVEEALGEEDRPKVRKRIEEAYFALKSVVRLNDQLLLVSQIDQGMVHPDMEYLPVQLFIAGVLKDVAAEARAHNLTVDAAPVPDTLGVTTDPKMLRRAVGEIFDNAIAYSKERGTIHCAVSERDGGLVIEVKNVGMGIPEEQQPLVFTKFFRGSNYDTSRIIGAGLGLYITREYLKLLGGKIWFTSKENGETAFSVFLPIRAGS